ncbi:MAG: Ribosomal RNA small subunit methyltransferase A [Parcubacteria group bacterium GW2011_GWA1_47_8]|nr:MAG: Ribosomal RNA small subunit methyltransferase A [Parcubacteria group bacterium GW2011_GWA1_47_8]
MLRAKKTLGQNFLNSKSIARDIVRAGELAVKDTVLEIGPGKGFLTAELLASGAHVIAVEKDMRLIPFLAEKFAAEIRAGCFTLIEGDILEIFETLDLPLPPSYKLIANIPYYITGQILRTFLEAKHRPERIILMVQKEIADRIIARDHKESILSLSVKAYGTPHLIKKVPARYFTPKPKVDSAVLAIKEISGRNFEDKKTEQKFFSLIKAGFAHKRKKLSGNLKELLGKEVLNILHATNISPDARAEDVPFDKWFLLSKAMRLIGD